MSANLQSLFDYLSVTEEIGTINQQRVKEIRLVYDQINKTNPDNSLQKLAETCRLVNDHENLEHLKICVNTNLSLVRQSLVAEYLKKKTSEIRNTRRTEKQEQTATNDRSTIEFISEVICQIFVKKNHHFIDEFIGTFLLETPVSSRSKNNERSIKKPVAEKCLLNTFIRHELNARGNPIDLGSSKARFPLVDPITIIDEFDTWHFDHLHDLFELNLIRENQTFPRQWQLAPNAQIFYKISSASDLSKEESTIRNVDRPSTVSLERFIEDICEKQNNGLAQKWIDALRSDDILTYADLTCLKTTEWNELKTLSFNGKRVLRSYIDREKQMTAAIKSNQAHQQQIIHSECELRANLHKIRLYFHYILDEHFYSKKILTPAKLDDYCVSAAFDEMRSDGFAEDGLFDQMKMFFLPLTMTEASLCIDDRRWRSMISAYKYEEQGWTKKREELVRKLPQIEDQYYTHDDAIIKLQKELRQNRQIRSGELQNMNASETFSLEELIKTHGEEKEKLESHRYDLRTKIQNIDSMIANVHSATEEQNQQDIKKINRDLIKPNRGFVMYGPPGNVVFFVK